MVSRCRFFSTTNGKGGNGDGTRVQASRRAVGFLNGLFGSGGGMLAVPLLEHRGLPPDRAHATSLAVILPLTAVSAGAYLLTRRRRPAGSTALPGRRTAGCLVGTRVLARLSPAALQRLFGRAGALCRRADVAAMSGLFGQAASGFGAAVLASMGMGGGSVLILWLTLVSGVGQREAQGLNLLFFLPVGALSLWLHRRAGRVDLPPQRPCFRQGSAAGCSEQRRQPGWIPGCCAGFCDLFVFHRTAAALPPAGKKAACITGQQTAKLTPEVQRTMNEPKTPMQKFLAGKGFYIALALCVAGTGTAACWPWTAR